MTVKKVESTIVSALERIHSRNYRVLMEKWEFCTLTQHY